MALNNFNWDVSSPALAAIVNGNNNLANGLEQFFGQKRAKRDYEEEQAKQRAQETTRLVTSLDTIGVLPKDVGTTKSLDELRGIRDGLIEQANIGEQASKAHERQLREQQILLAIAAGQQQMQTQQAEQPFRLQQLQQAIAAGQQQQQAGQALQQVVAGAATPGAPELSTPGIFGAPVAGEMQPGFDREKLLAALTQHPQAANAPNLDNLLRAVQSGGEQGVDAMPVPFDVNGMKGIFSKRTGAIHTQTAPNGPQLADKLQTIDRTALQTRKTAITKALGGDLTPDVKDFYTQELEGINAQLGGVSAAGEVPPDHAAYLKAHPEYAASFDKKYGAGASKKILGK